MRGKLSRGTNTYTQKNIYCIVQQVKEKAELTYKDDYQYNKEYQRRYGVDTQNNPLCLLTN